VKFLPLFLSFAFVAASQTHTSSNQGWSFAGTLKSATEVIVADITSGTGIDNGTVVGVQATLNSVRVLAGNLTPGAGITVEWQYHPESFESPAVTARVPKLRGLFFLRKSPSGGFEPLPAVGPFVPLGGYTLPLETGDAVFCPADESLPSKIACELGTALESLVTLHAADFEPHRPQAPANGALAPWVRTRMQYQALRFTLDALDPAAAAPVYRRLSALPDANLKSVGLAGRLRGGDINSIFDVEKNLPQLLSTNDAGSISFAMTTLDLTGYGPAAHALGRMAISETPLPGAENAFVFRIGWTHDSQFLPYLAVMLENPDPAARSSVILAFCTLLAKPNPLWQSRMTEFCPVQTPIRDREEEAGDTAFWKQWWTEHREQIAAISELPAVSAPARYGSQPSPNAPAEAPIEIRFQSLLNMSANTGNDPVASRLNPADRETYSLVVKVTSGRLQTLQQQGQQMLNAARIAGKPPDAEQSKLLWTSQEAALKSGVQQLHDKLSPDGWTIVETAMKNRGVVSFQPPQQ
jgi:hypothetical protein